MGGGEGAVLIFFLFKSNLTGNKLNFSQVKYHLVSDLSVLP